MSKKTWVTVERFVLVFGALLGTLAFFWQVYNSVSERTERASAYLVCKSTSDSEILLDIEVINTGQRSIFIRRIDIISQDRIDEGFNMPILVIWDDPNPANPVLPGGAVTFSKSLSLESALSLTESPIFIRVYSPVGNLTTLQDVGKPITNFAKLVSNFIVDGGIDPLGISLRGCGISSH